MSKITRFTNGYYRYYRKNQLLSLSPSLSVENGLSVIPARDPTVWPLGGLGLHEKAPGTLNPILSGL